MDRPPDHPAEGPAAGSRIEADGPLPAARRFERGRPLPGDVLRRILRRATVARSGYDLQPWRFLVVRSPRNRARLAACCYGQTAVAEAAAVVVVLGYQHPHRTHLDALLDGLVRLGALSAAEAAYRRGLVGSALERLPDPGLWAVRSATPAAHALIVAAATEGVDAAWIDGFREEALRQSFGVPDDHAICAVIALGFAAEREAPTPRLALEEICFEEHFGQPWEGGES